MAEFDPYSPPKAEYKTQESNEENLFGSITDGAKLEEEKRQWWLTLIPIIIGIVLIRSCMG